MPTSPRFECKICGGPHGGMHKAMCIDCAKKWKADVDQLGSLVRSLATDPSDFPAHVRKVSGEIEQKLGKMKGMFKH